jgi:hypothetical protein
MQHQKIEKKRKLLVSSATVFFLKIKEFNFCSQSADHHP